MKRVFEIACLGALFLPAQPSAVETYVPGHYDADGTYVHPRKETMPIGAYKKEDIPDRDIDPYRGKTRLEGYYRENGTYVYPQERKVPNRSYYNNLSRDRVIYHENRKQRYAWPNSGSPQRRYDRKRDFTRRYGQMGGSVPYGPGFRRY